MHIVLTSEIYMVFKFNGFNECSGRQFDVISHFVQTVHIITLYVSIYLSKTKRNVKIIVSVNVQLMKEQKLFTHTFKNREI